MDFCYEVWRCCMLVNFFKKLRIHHFAFKGQVQYSPYWNPDIRSIDDCYKIKLSKIPGTAITIEEAEFTIWGSDSISMIYHNDYVYSIGGYNHFLYSKFEKRTTKIISEIKICV